MTNSVPPPAPRSFALPGQGFWVFAYGSLMWRPDFAFAERHMARIHGCHRRFCIYSHRYRGTPENPGLVLGLDQGGSCLGVAYKVAPGDAEAVTAYLWEREMVTGVYRPSMRRITINGVPTRAAAFIADRHHRQYFTDRSIAAMAELILSGHGKMGPNTDYLFNTVCHLRDMGIRDLGLERLSRFVEKRLSGEREIGVGST